MMQGHLEDKDDLFALHLTPEIATRKSRLVLSLMVSLAGGAKRPRGRRRAEGDPQAADRERAQVAQLVRDLIDDRMTPEDFQPRISRFLPICRRMTNLVAVFEMGLPALRAALATGEVTIKGVNVGFGEDENNPVQQQQQQQQQQQPAPMEEEHPKASDEEELTSIMEEVMNIQ